FPFIFLLILNLMLKINIIIKLFFYSCLIKFLVFIVSTVDYELVFILTYWKELFIRLNHYFKERAMHPTYFSTYIGLGFIFCIYFIKIKKLSLQKYWWFLMLIISFIISLLLTAKMPFISLSISIIIVFILYIIKKFSAKKLIVFVVIFTITL